MGTEISLSKIKWGFLNVQSVGNKTFELRNLVNEGKFDVLALAETWLCEYDSAKIAEMTPSTHLFLHVPRGTRRGGGVGVFVSNSFSKLKKEDVVEAETFEYMHIQ